MNKYLERDTDGKVDWSKKGFKMLRYFPQLMEDGLDFTCRKLLGELLEDRGFKRVVPYEIYFLGDENRSLEVTLNDDCLRVKRNYSMFNAYPMHYDQGECELCELWKVVRKAWNADD